MLKTGNKEVVASLLSVQKSLASMADKYYNDINEIIDELSDLNCQALNDLLTEYLGFQKGFDSDINGFITKLTDDEIQCPDYDVYAEFNKLFDLKKEIFYFLRDKKKVLFLKHGEEIAVARYEKIRKNRELNLGKPSPDDAARDLNVLEEIKDSIFVNNYDKKKEFYSLKFDILIEVISATIDLNYINMNSEELRVYNFLMLESLAKIDIGIVYFMKDNNYYNELVNEIKNDKISYLSIRKYALFFKEYKQNTFDSIKKNIKNAR